MSLGVLNNLSAMYAENNLNNTTNSLNTVLQQLSSGSKINSGADDAAGLSLVDGLQANSQALAQSQTNAQEGVGMLQVADGALSQVTSLLNRAVTLATEASNGTLNSSQDSAANNEYQSILSEINNIGTTTTYNGQTVFGQTGTNIYTGDSSTSGASIDSLNIQSLSSSNVGDSNGAMSYSNGTSNVFINLSNGGQNASINDSLGADSATTTIEVGYMTTGQNGSAVAAQAPISVGAGTSYANNAQGLISAINNSGLGLSATFATAAQAGTSAVASAETAGGSGTDTGIEISAAGIGTGTNGVGVVGSMALDAGQTLSGTLNVVGSDGASHNITLGTQNSTDNLVNLASTINAAGYGVTATANQAGTQLTFTTADSAVSVSGTNIEENTAASSNTATIQGSSLGTLSVGGASDTLAGTLNVTSGVDGTTNHTITLGTQGSTDTLANLAASFSGSGANAGLGISATLSNNDTTITFGKANADGFTPAVAASNIIDVAAPTIAASSTLGSLTLAAAGDTLAATGDLNIVSGITGKAATPIALGTAGSTDTLANLATTINNGGYGITAAVDTTGTILTFTANAGNAHTAVIAGSGTITDTSALHTVATFTGAQTTLGSITVATAGDTVGDGTATDGLVLSGNSQAGVTVDLATTAQTLSQIAASINTADAAYGITATLNQAGTTLTFAKAAGTTGAITTSGTLVDNVAAVDTQAAVAPQNGSLGTMTVLNSSNVITSGTLDVTQGLAAGEATTTHSIAGLTLGQIADNFNNAKTYSTATPTNWSADGITATLNSAGTVLTFSQASGDLGTAAISSSPTSAPVLVTPVISTGATLGSVTVNQKADTLAGTLNLTNGITGASSTLALGTSGSTDTLANLVTTINNGGYGITATANQAGTMLTFTQTSGAAAAAVSNTGSIGDTTAAVNNSAISVASNVLTAASSSDTLSGTLDVTPNGGSLSAYSFTGKTLSQIESSFNSPDGANYASNITAVLSGSALSFTTNGGSISGTGIADYTPASTAPQSVAAPTIMNTLTAANSADLMSGTFQVHSGNTAGTTLSTITLTAPQTLAQIADDFNNVAGGNATDKTNLGGLGISAALNTAAIGTVGQAGYRAIGTVLTLTQTAGDPDQANVVTTIGTTTLVDQTSASNLGQAESLTAGGTLTANTIAVTTAGNKLTGTLKLVEGVDSNSTASYLNLNGQTLAQIANDFNTSTGTVNLSNLGITAVLNNATPSSATGISFIANAGETGAANVAVTTTTPIVQQTGTSTSTVTTGSGTMLDTLNVNNASDKLAGTLNLTSGLTGSAAPTITLGASGTTDTLANLASTINSGQYGVTATLNAAKTELTFAQTAGDGFAAAVSGTSVTDSAATSYASSTGLGTLTANTAADTLTGTFTGVGANGTTPFTLNINNQTLAQVEASINSDNALGITASIDKAGTQLSFAATNGDAGTPTIGNYGNITDTTVSTQTAVSITGTPTSGVANSSTLGSVSISSLDTLGGSITIGGQTLNIGSSDNSAATLASTINKGNYGVQAAYNANSGQLTFTSPNSAMGISTSSLDETAPGSTTGTAVGNLTGASTSSGYYSRGITGTVTDTSTLGGTKNVGITTNANGSGGIATISYKDGAGQSLSATSLSNQASAQTALTDLNKAITAVAAQDGYIGAQINTLNSVSSVLSTQQQNVVSAQNAVQATDYASATSNMSKYEILSQTGIAALAQANSLSQEVTKLLQ